MDKSKNPPGFSRIDLLLLSHDCFLDFLGICQKVLQRMILDHFPKCITSDDIQ